VNGCEVYGKAAELDHECLDHHAIFELEMRVVIERRRAIRQNDERCVCCCFVLCVAVEETDMVADMME